MGKKTRRKGRHSNNKGNKNRAPYQDADNNNDDEATSSSSSSALLQRIRHSDPRTRHAALAAVANTLLDTSTSSSRGVHPKVTPTLLAAIRERVMDADLDVCQVAAGCLANYVTIAAAAAATADSRKQQELQTLSSGWTILLVGRLQQCYERVVVVAAAAEGSHPQPPKHQKQWLAVAVQCWRTLCVLVETNPAAVGRLTSALDATPRHDFHRTTLEWLQHGQSWWLSSRPVAATATVDNNSKALEDASRPFYEQILSLAARTLHSAWDDNAELLLPWKEECPDAFRRALELLQSMASPASQSLPVDTQLHATGAILAARPFMGAQQQQQQQVILELTAHTVVPQLVQRLSSFSWDTVQSLLANYQAIVEVWEKEQADDALERDVIRKVEDRKEPARQIAKRQKAQKEANANANSATENNTADMKEEESKMEEDDLNKKVEEEIETQEALERARQKWNVFLLPLQLSLELLANVSSRAASSGNEDEEEEDRMMMDDNDWGPEREAQWMQDKQQEQERLQKQKAEDEIFQRVLVDSALPGQLVQLFRQVYQTPQASTTAISFPEQSRDDLEDLQSKVMACLGNCWENISFWPLEVTWAELQQAAATATGVGKEGVVSAMVIALKTKPSLRKEWQPEHLTFWLQHVSNNSASSKGDTSNTMMPKDQSQQQQGNLSVRRDAITMLSVLCSQEPHPVEVNRQVCTTLLSALTNPSAPLMVQCEILNSLMDMYGNDEDDGCCYQSVFENLQVLGHFQRCIPALKSKLKEEERKVKQGAQGDHGADRLELEQWKETVLNSSRFVQYKKGQL